VRSGTTTTADQYAFLVVRTKSRVADADVCGTYGSSRVAACEGVDVVTVRIVARAVTRAERPVTRMLGAAFRAGGDRLDPGEYRILWIFAAALDGLRT
jgi:hypothetical protein